jgi:hypothetical protein
VNALSTLANLIVDCMIAAVALWMIYRGLRFLYSTMGNRWSTTPVPVDPAATEVWDVLAEARQITRDAADAAE